MDPIVTYCQMLDTGADPADRVDAAQALREWIRSGGFLPHGTERADVETNIEIVLSQHVEG